MERKNLSLNKKYFYPTEEKYRMTEMEILDAIREDKLFGAVEVDISVPEELKSYFADLPPIFKNTIVTHEDIGEHMQEFLKEKDQRLKDTKYLVASMVGTKILIITPLLKWYLEKGLKVEKIHQVVEFSPKKCFKPFADQVSDDRRKGNISLGFRNFKQFNTRLVV